MTERNWTEIEEDYRAGVISIGAICRKHELPRDKLMSKARRDAWSRSLANEVNQEVQERLAFAENEPGIDAITKAAAMQVEAILGQRKDISRLRDLVGKSADSIERILNGESTEADAATLGRAGVVGALDTLGSVMQRLIPMERVAMGIGLTDPSAPGANPAGGGSVDSPSPVVTFYLPQNHREPKDE